MTFSQAGLLALGLVMVAGELWLLGYMWTGGRAAGEPLIANLLANAYALVVVGGIGAGLILIAFGFGLPAQL